MPPPGFDPGRPVPIEEARSLLMARLDPVLAEIAANAAAWELIRTGQPNTRRALSFAEVRGEALAILNGFAQGVVPPPPLTGTVLISAGNDAAAWATVYNGRPVLCTVEVTLNSVIDLRNGAEVIVPKADLQISAEFESEDDSEPYINVTESVEGTLRQ